MALCLFASLCSCYLGSGTADANAILPISFIAIVSCHTNTADNAASGAVAVAVVDEEAEVAATKQEKTWGAAVAAVGVLRSRLWSLRRPTPTEVRHSLIKTNEVLAIQKLLG